MNQTEFAAICGYTLKHVNRIIQGHARITAESALVFERVLDVRAEFWMNLQSNFDLQAARLALHFGERPCVMHPPDDCSADLACVDCPEVSR